MKFAGQGELDRSILSQAQKIALSSTPGMSKFVPQRTTPELPSLGQFKSNYLCTIAISYLCV
jgi:hypothetical protein